MYLKNEMVFIDLKDNEIKSCNCYRIFKKYGRQANVNEKKLFLHNLRHFYTIDEIKNNTDLNTLAQNLGIENLETLKIYQSRDIEIMKEKAKKMGEKGLI